MKTILVASPHFYFCNALSIPRLAGYLKKKGHNIIQRQIDLEIFDILFSIEEMNNIFSLIKEKTLIRYARDAKFKELIRKELLRFSQINPSLEKLGIDSSNPEAIEDIINCKEIIIKRIFDAQRNMSEFYTTKGQMFFATNLGILYLATLLIKFAYYPTYFSLADGISMRYSPFSSDDICKAIEDKEENFLIGYYEKYFYPWIENEKPEILGVSINHPSQIIPSFTMMSWMKKNLTNTHLTIGGATVTYIREHIIKCKKLWNFFDSLIIGMGEKSLDELINCLAMKGDFSNIPGLIYKEGDSIKKSKENIICMDDISTPDYIENRPGPVIPIQTAIGCQYNKCSFCDFHNSVLQGNEKTLTTYHSRSVDLILNDLIELNEKHNPLFFFFTDHSIPHMRLEKLADKIIEKKIKIRFFVWIRAEKKFTSLEFCNKLAKAGCIGVDFGLEVGSQRVNDLMNKGVKITDVQKILENLTATNIIPNLFVMVGCPTETEEEIMTTLDFLKKNRRHLIGEISIMPFNLKLKAGILKDLDKYKITKIYNDTKEDLFIHYKYEVSDGVNQETTLKLLAKINRELNLAYNSGSFLSEVIKRVYGMKKCLD